MQQLNQRHPDNYLLAMRILWAPIGLIIICWAILPESPWFHARRGNKEGALKAMKQLYGGIEGFDYEEEYGIIERTISHEREVNKGAPKYRDVFKGLNLVSIAPIGRTAVSDTPETNPVCCDALCLPAARRSCYHQHLLYVYVPHHATSS